MYHKEGNVFIMFVRLVCSTRHNFLFLKMINDFKIDNGYNVNNTVTIITVLH